MDLAMVAPELIAYPALTVAMFGAYRVGRGRKPMDENFERVRVVTLALLLGILFAVQWRLVTAGIVRSTLGIVTGACGLGACAGLVALHCWQFMEERRAVRLVAPSHGPS